ncbi:MAG: response regulator transcription factor [Pseudonocardiaceae bacterium]|nr:MAG: response regulator transcription factor [Pseudonocardiaceae bacterium]
MERLRVLVIDDHRVFTDLLTLALGLEPDLDCVAVAHTAREGLTRAAATAPDVVVVDIGLPDASGLDVVTAVRRDRPATRVVVLTAHPRPDIADRALRAGAAAFLAKDAPLHRILEALRTADPARPVIGPELAGADRVRLTPREHDVLRQLAQGRDATRAAAALGITVATARGHIKTLMAKLGVHSQLEAVVSADRLGLVTVGTSY